MAKTVGRQKAEGRRQKAESRRQKAEFRSQILESGIRNLESAGCVAADDGAEAAEVITAL
jgi:hypothetical protein